MVISAWIVFIIIVGFIITNIITYKKNKTYRNKIRTIVKKKWVMVLVGLLMPILLYTIGTSFLIMVQGDCFVGHYSGSEWYNNVTVYYGGNKYFFICDAEQEKEAYEYGAGQWKYTDTYIMGDSLVGFPYLEYWCPKFFRDELILPGDLEPIYLRVNTAGGTIYYIRQDNYKE